MKKILMVISTILLTSLLLYCKETDLVILSTKVYPTPFAPNDGQDVTLELNIKSSLNIQDLQVSAVIFNFNDKRVWTFQKTFTASPISQVNLQWGGQNDNGATVNPGLYKAQIIVEVLETVSGAIGGKTDTVELTIIVE